MRRTLGKEYLQSDRNRLLDDLELLSAELHLLRLGKHCGGLPMLKKNRKDGQKESKNGNFRFQPAAHLLDWQLTGRLVRWTLKASSADRLGKWGGGP